MPNKTIKIYKRQQYNHIVLSPLFHYVWQVDVEYVQNVLKIISKNK